MKTPKSSWNSDRMAAAHCNRKAKRAFARRPDRYAQYKTGGDTVEVVTIRGRKVFSRRFGDEIVSACIMGEKLEVETANGSRYVCDAETGKVLEPNVEERLVFECPEWAARNTVSAA